MNIENRTTVILALLASLFAISALPEAGGQSPPPNAQAVGHQDPDETEEEKEKKKKKKQQEEQKKQPDSATGESPELSDPFGELSPTAPPAEAP
jgi:hypothetical protein